MILLTIFLGFLAVIWWGAVIAYAITVRKNEQKNFCTTAPLQNSSLYNLPKEMITASELVIKFGAEKYELDGWKNQWDGYYYYVRKAEKHINASNVSHLDSESGLPHLAHAVVNLSFALWHYQQKKNGG